MSISIRIFISMPSDRWLNDNQNRLKWAIVDKIRDLGFIPEIFSNPRYMPGKISNQNWDPDKASEIMRACIGGVLFGLPRWQFNTDNGVAKLATEFSHYEGALMKQLKLPMLIVAQQDISQRTVFNYNFDPNMGFFNENDAKMPADLGSDIYGAVDETNDINAIQSAIDFFSKAF